MGAALWQRTQGPGRATSAEVEARFVNASLCRLLAFLSLALTRTVAVEDAARCARPPHSTLHPPHLHARPQPTTARRRRSRTSAALRRRSFDAKLDTWRTLLSTFGLGRPHLCALLDAASKGLLLYIDAVVRSCLLASKRTLALALALALALTPALTVTRCGVTRSCGSRASAARR